MQSKKDKLRQYVLELISKAERAVYYLNSPESIVLKVVIKDPIKVSESLCQEIYNSTLSIFEKLYGLHSQQAHQLRVQHDNFLHPDDDRFFASDILLPSCHGRLKSILNDIDNDLIGNLDLKISSEVFGNFLSSATHALDSGNKDIAAVIASAALEDILKKIGEVNGLDVSTKTIEKVAEVLKSKMLLKGSSSKLIGGFIVIRNKAFHAEWTKIHAEDVGSMIGFTERLLIEHFGNK